jgi:ABC-2 type transport system ATP-binding protein
VAGNRRRDGGASLSEMAAPPNNCPHDAEATQTRLEIDSLTKRYGEVTAVDGLSLRVAAGEVFGFLGPNGAGKSTTIDILLDFVRPTSGSVRVCGHDPQTAPRAVRRRVGVLPEATGYYERASAREHVQFAVELKRADHGAARLLERVGLADAGDRPVGGFSKGMRQRLGVAMALVGRPDLLVLDEPLAGLDPAGARRVRTLVREERDRGAAVLLSSHITEQVETLCDRVGILSGGDLAMVDTVVGLRERLEADRPVVLTLAERPTDLAVETLDGVTGVCEGGASVRVTCRDAAAAGPVVAQLDAAGTTLLDVDSRGGSLEQLFLTLTDDEQDEETAGRMTVAPRRVDR